MDREFLEGLGLEDGVAGQILEAHAGDVERETRARLEYVGAVQNAVERLGLKFSSKAAERDFYARLREEQLAVEDGAVVGLEEFIRARREADPGAFSSSQPAPRFVAPAGLGCAQESAPANVVQARAMGAERAAARRASGEVMKNFL